MGVGSAVRRRLGRLEIPVTNAYRAFFVNLHDVASLTRSLGRAKRILEIGSGEGALLEQLALAFPDADLLGIDIAVEPGRLFRGNRTRVSFRSISTGNLLAENPLPFDLTVICDVLHHVPPEERDELLRDACRLTAPGGLLVIKDWERSRGIAHALAYLSDRYISGETVAYFAPGELPAELQRVIPDGEVVLEARIPPCRNNVAFAVRVPTIPT